MYGVENWLCLLITLLVVWMVLVCMVTVRDLESIAAAVRDDLSEIHGYCWPASNELQKQLATKTNADRSEISVEEVLVGTAGCRHYVVAYPARYVEDLDASGRIIIDITLDQYSDANVADGLVKASVEDSIDLRPIYIFRQKSDAPYSG